MDDKESPPVSAASGFDPSRDETQARADAVAGAMFIASADNEKEFVTGPDGFVVYWPTIVGGFNAWTLRLFADELDRRNAAWQAEIDAYFARDSDGSPEGRDAQRLDGEAATARAGTASPEQDRPRHG